MPKAPIHHIVPKSGRFSIVLGQRALKELRKLAIDLEVPENALIDLAVVSLLQKYRNTPMEQIEARGIACFLDSPEDESWKESWKQKRASAQDGEKPERLATENK